MAKTKRKPFGVDAQALVKLLGRKAVIEALGAKNVLDELGAERLINELGPEALASLSPATRRKLKELLEGG